MGNCLFLRARGWGIDRQMKTKLQIPGGMPGGDMVTGRIEPCITRTSDLATWVSDFSNSGVGCRIFTTRKGHYWTDETPKSETKVFRFCVSRFSNVLSEASEPVPPTDPPGCITPADTPESLPAITR